MFVKMVALHDVYRSYTVICSAYPGDFFVDCCNIFHSGIFTILGEVGALRNYTHVTVRWLVFVFRIRQFAGSCLGL